MIQHVMYQLSTQPLKVLYQLSHKHVGARWRLFAYSFVVYKILHTRMCVVLPRLALVNMTWQRGRQISRAVLNAATQMLKAVRGLQIVI